VTISVLGSVQLAVPAAVYSVRMFPVAAVFGWAITRTAKRPAAQEVTAEAR
jgi:BASS family bile acid:Na+ symporter